MRVVLKQVAVLAVLLVGAGLAVAGERSAAEDPLAILDGPSWVRPGGEARFSGLQSFRPGGRIVGYRFALGDEVVEGAGGEATFRGLAAGEHEVRLTVTCDRGTEATVRQPLLVEPMRQHMQRRLEGRERRGVVLLMCEDGDPRTAEAVEEVGERILRPLLASAYGEVAVIRGERARPDDFFDSIRAVAERRDAVDVIILAHGSPGRLWLKERRYITGEDIVEQLEGRGGERVRMVYSSLCWGETLNAAWREAGADASAGAVDVNVPIGLAPFLIGWLRGEEFGSLTGRSFAFNQQVHAFRNRSADQLRPALNLLTPMLGAGSVGRTLRFYIDHILDDDLWEIWRSYPVIDGGGVTIDTFPAASGP